MGAGPAADPWLPPRRRLPRGLSLAEVPVCNPLARGPPGDDTQKNCQNR
jgi:hypothetical protein